MCERPNHLSQYADSNVRTSKELRLTSWSNSPPTRPSPAVMSMLPDLRNAGKRVWTTEVLLPVGPDRKFPLT